MASTAELQHQLPSVQDSALPSALERGTSSGQLVEALLVEAEFCRAESVSVEPGSGEW